MQTVRWSKLGSRWKLVLLLLIPSTLFSFIIISYAFNQIMDYLRQTQKEAITGMSNQIVLLLKKDVEQIVNIMLELEQTILRNNPSTDRTSESIATISSIRSDFIRGIIFKNDDGSFVGYPENYWGHFSDREFEIIDSQKLSGYPPIVWSPQFSSHIGKRGTFTPVSLVSKLVSDEDGIRIGTLSFVIDLTSFLDRSSAFSGNYDTQTLLYDQNGTLIDSLYSINGRPVRSSIEETRYLASVLDYFEQEGFYYALSEDSATGWKIIVVGDIEELERKFKPVTELAVLFFIIGISGFICIYAFVSWWFTRPVILLIRGIRRVSQGDFNYHVEMERQDEIGELVKQFNYMTQKIKGLIHNLQRTEELKRKSDFQSLLAQINPHFLYNTLNSIDMMIDFGTKEEVHSIISVLSRMLKYALNRSGEVSTLREELMHVRDYVYLQSLRYENRFDFHVDELQAHEDTKVLKLILQPLVENAVFHGLHPLTGRKGHLSVKVNREEDALRIEIEDNGVGMSEEMCRRLTAPLQEEDTQSGIGYRNVHQRIQRGFGK